MFKLILTQHTIGHHFNQQGSPSAFSSFLSLYRSVRKRLLTRVDFPRPDSPERERERESTALVSEMQIHQTKEKEKE